MNDSAILNKIEDFFADWSRRDWMTEHGEWASDDWAEARAAYAEAQANLDSALEGLAEAEDVRDTSRAKEVLEAAQALFEAAKDLEGQPTGESDYIAEGVIDPDEVADSAEELDIGERWEGWDCTEGWDAYRVGEALYIRWYRDARGHRRHRDLWVLVDSDFFASAE